MVRLAECQSCSGHFIRRTISAISRQELQTVFSNLFTSCQTYQSVQEGNFQHPL